MVGSAIVRRLLATGHPQDHIVTRVHSELDLTDQRAVSHFIQTERPDHIYLAAAKVGGIHANNTFPADFIYENLMIECNVIHAAHSNDVGKLLFLGSSCIYPRLASQPMQEDALLTGTLEPTNEPYAIAKIAGIKLCESYHRQHGRDYRSVMPTNLYGPGDNYHPTNSHVIPALIRRFHDAKIADLHEVSIWGSGTPKREFLFVDDMADACVYVMNLAEHEYWDNINPLVSHINVGYGQDLSIRDLAELVKDVVGYEGRIQLDATKPDGAPRKLMDSAKLASLGWRAQTDLRSGLEVAYSDFLNNHSGANKQV